MTAGYATVTYKMKLTCKRLDWLAETKDLYNHVRTFYHALILEHEELYKLGSQAMLRELEKLSLTGRCGEAPVSPLPYERIPAYFRRSAVNGAIGAFRTYQQNHRRWEQEREKAVQRESVSPENHIVPEHEKMELQYTANITENTTGNTASLGRKKGAGPGTEQETQAAHRAFRKREPQPAREFHSSPVFYKGMYKDFTGNAITLKLWTGSTWAWVRCRYRGRPLPEKTERMSPTVVLSKKGAMLHIPVRQEVADTRPVKKRVAEGGSVCSVAFTNTDAFAVCSVHTVDGRAAASRFIRGGAEYVHHSKRLLERIRSNRAVMGKRFDWTGCSKRYWQRLNNLGEYWAHKVSKEIVDFCLKNKVTTIAIMEPDYEKMRLIARSAGKYSPIYLSLRVRRYLTYKAWKAGIAVTFIQAGTMTKVCSHCGALLLRVQGQDTYSTMKKIAAHVGSSNKSGDRPKAVCCTNGHRLDWNLNLSRNIGRSCFHKLGIQSA